MNDIIAMSDSPWQPGHRPRIVRFVAEGQPQPQGSMVAFKDAKTNRIVVKSANPSLHGWRDTVTVAARQAWDAEPTTGAVSLTLVFWLARPATVKRKSPTVKPDLDKLERACLDAMTHVVYRDDGQVTHIDASKRYCDATVRFPIVAVTVTEVEA